MADVFLSYAQEDRTRARQLADALRERGWDVWWDAHVYVGTRFRAEITRQLQSAKCVVVLWSQASIKSDWVIDEAEVWRKRGVLVQALIDDVPPPHGFRGSHWANLNSWSGETQAEEFVKLADGISRLAPVATSTPTPAAHAPRPDSPPAHTAHDSDQAPETQPLPLQWRIATDRFTAHLAKRRRFVVAGLGVVIAVALTIYVSGLPVEQAQQTPQPGSDKPVVPSSSSAAPSSDATLGQNSGKESAPGADRSPSAKAPSSPPQPPALTSATEDTKAASGGSRSSPRTTTRQTDWREAPKSNVLGGVSTTGTSTDGSIGPRSGALPEAPSTVAPAFTATVANVEEAALDLLVAECDRKNGLACLFAGQRYDDSLSKPQGLL